MLDVAQALSNLVGAKGASESVTFNLPGPTVHSYASLLNLIQSVTYNSIGFAPTIPKSFMLTASKVAQAAWWPLLSPDEVERRYIDDVGTDAKGEHWQGDWDKFGITPEEVENLAITYLRRYRTAYVLWKFPICKLILTAVGTLQSELLEARRPSLHPWNSGCEYSIFCHSVRNAASNGKITQYHELD